jgi:hypothetical protein
MKPGECAVICATVEREDIEQGFSSAGLPVIDDGVSAVLRDQVATQLRAFGAAAKGLGNDATIGATALENGIPLITGDRALASAVMKLGGVVRLLRPRSVITMTLNVTPVVGGCASLGSWGTLELTGAASALLRLNWSESVELNETVAADITAGVLLLNEEMGRLLFLPYAGWLIVAYDLKEGEPVYPPVAIPRDEDRGMRMSIVRVLPGVDALYLTEATLARFSGDCMPMWRVDEDFAGWSIEGVTHDEVLLVTGDWTGREDRQSRSLADGSRSY